MSEKPDATPKTPAYGPSHGMLVQCVDCVENDGRYTTHIFSSREAMLAFVDADRRDHIIYEYVIDVPERMEQRRQ